jgi:hypothetical protein
MIRGYPRWPTVSPGDKLTLHVATNAPRFRVEFYRQGERLEKVEGLAAEAFPGYDFAEGSPDRDWGWPGYELALPGSWRPGVYVVGLIEIDERGRETAPDMTTADGTSAKALFVLRNPRPGTSTSILYKLSWATWHAYNGTGYGSLYDQAVWSKEDEPPGYKVTWRRPGGGTGGQVMFGDSLDAYEPEVRRQTFQKWDVPLISWLEANGIEVDYCTDLDLQREERLLEPYQLLLSVGHDEYWSDEMRERVESFIARGGNVAWLSGNISSGRIHFTDGDTAITCAKVPPGPKERVQWLDDHWQEVRPENIMTGVASRHAGGWWDGKRDTLGYTVQHSGHWVFEGTGLQDGDVFGDDPDYPLIGYEVDGAAFVRRKGLALATGENGTPESFFILGVAELTPGFVKSSPHNAATMGVYTSHGGGIVFQGACTDWPILVPRNKKVAQITRNVIDRLRLRSLRVLGPLPHIGGRTLAVTSQTARFQADAAGLGSLDSLEFEWQVEGGSPERTEGPLIEVGVPERAGAITVSVTASKAGQPIAFGSTTTVSLTREEQLKLEILVALREAVMPGNPHEALVHPYTEPLAQMGLLYSKHSVRIPWLKEKAARIVKSTEALLELPDLPDQ